MKLSRRFAMMGMAAAGVAASSQLRAATASRPGTAFGTTVRLTISAQSQAEAEACCDAGFSEIRKVERTFSLFDPSSELMRLNAMGVLHDPSQMMLELLSHAKRLWQMTDGAFDPTVQKLWEAWNRNPVTASGEIAVLRKDIGFQHVDVTDRSITLLNRNAALTLNGIAQGFACDCVAHAIAPLGAQHAVLDTGEVAVIGDDGSQRFAIAHPRRKGGAIGYLTVPRGFVATSGDYASNFTPDFVHHHIFDPATGESPVEIASATVVASSGAEADGLATAVMVMGPQGAHRLLRRCSELSVLLVRKNLSVADMTRGMFAMKSTAPNRHPDKL